MPQSIAFHSYRGGTGKSTIAANLSALLCAKGFKVSLIDADIYAPSLHNYFDYYPQMWINDFISGNAEISDIMVDMTPVVSNTAKAFSGNGKLWIGFSNPHREEIYRLEGGTGKNTSAKIHLLRKFIKLHEDLISEFNSDYVIIDTSPGIRFWSINSLAIADTLLLVLKFGDTDIEGTRRMADEIYRSFTRFGAKSFILLNRVGGYCIPNTRNSSFTNSNVMDLPNIEESDVLETLSHKVGIGLISVIPCYCDIQFSRREFLTALYHPEHPFSKKLESLTCASQMKV